VRAIASRRSRFRLSPGFAQLLFQIPAPMALPTAVNDQITDAVTQSSVKVIADAPAHALGTLYQATAQALANAAHNATMAQQQSNVTAQAATTQGVALLFGADTAASRLATKAILSS
jgi:hypothetical protein